MLARLENKGYRNRAVLWANGPNAAIAAYRTIQVGSARNTAPEIASQIEDPNVTPNQCNGDCQ
jgi:hypothetical protein